MLSREQSREVALRFGCNVRRSRRRADLSQEELSIRAAVHRTEIGLVENGERVPRLDTVLKLAGGIEIDPCVLLDGMAWMPQGFRQGSFYVVGEVPSRRRPAG
jgi:transcriptional regulator with XRE-family HTH domain